MGRKISIDKSQINFRLPIRSLETPSYLIEITYLGLLVYLMVVGPALRLLIPMVGAGTLAALVVICLLHFGSHTPGALKPIRFALACGISLLILQVGVFQESIMHSWMRNFLTWVMGLVVIQSLSFRKGFLHRFAIIAFLIGCGTLPFMRVYEVSDELMRVGGEGVPLGNPNFFGMWFGFCAIYFIVTGLEAKNYIIRSFAWFAAILCLYFVAITVSRGALFGVAIATVIAFQKILKRSFLPILGFLILLWIVYLTGVFDGLIAYYLHRGAEETGRSRLWAWAIDKIWGAWGMGVGMSNSFFIVDEESGETAGPHNSFLFILLSSGFIPLIFYVAYLFQATKGAFRAQGQNNPDSPYLLPMVSFALLAVMVADTTFMSPWHMIVFSLAIATPNVMRILDESSPRSISRKTLGREVREK